MAVTVASDLSLRTVERDLILDDVLLKTPSFINSPIVSTVMVEGAAKLKVSTYNTDTTGFVKSTVLDSRVGVTPNKLTMDSYELEWINETVSIDESMPAISDAIGGEEGLAEHKVRMVANEVRSRFTRVLIDRAMDTPLAYDTIADASVDDSITAKLLWGDHSAMMATSFMVMHSRAWLKLAKSTDFKTLGSAATPAFVQLATGGQPSLPFVGIIHGMGVLLCDQVRNSYGLTVASITRSGAVATLTTVEDHGQVAGMKLRISGATETEYNGTHTITGTPTSKTLTFAVSGTPATPATGSPVIVPLFYNLICQPAALSLYIRKNVETVEHRHAGSAVRTTDFHWRFQGDLTRVQPRPVIKYPTT